MSLSNSTLDKVFSSSKSSHILFVEKNLSVPYSTLGKKWFSTNFLEKELDSWLKGIENFKVSKSPFKYSSLTTLLECVIRYSSPFLDFFNISSFSFSCYSLSIVSFSSFSLISFSFLFLFPFYLFSLFFFFLLFLFFSIYEFSSLYDKFFHFFFIFSCFLCPFLSLSYDSLNLYMELKWYPWCNFSFNYMLQCASSSRIVVVDVIWDRCSGRIVV